MAENTKVSAFVAVMSRLEDLTESELRQVHLAIGVRLGFPGAAAPGPSGGGGQSAPSRTGPVGRGRASLRNTGGSAARAKGNPQRKSQWANHPLYQEYHRLQKAVERQAKDAKTSFNAVNTDESRQYRVALSRWLEAKSSFRDRQTSESNSVAEAATKPSAETGKPRTADSVKSGNAGLELAWDSAHEAAIRKSQASWDEQVAAAGKPADATGPQSWTEVLRRTPSPKAGGSKKASPAKAGLAASPESASKQKTGSPGKGKKPQ